MNSLLVLLLLAGLAVLLAEFAAGGTRHKDSVDAESPLKDHLPRIKELLGLK